MSIDMFPSKVQIELTNLCNYSCEMCPILDLQRATGFIRGDLYRRIIDECAAHDPMVWNHFIGEPLLHPEAESLLEYGVSAGLRLGLSTNASLLSAARAERLLDLGLERLGISLDAATPSTYRRIRGKSDLHDIEANVRRLLDRKYTRSLSRPVISLQFVKQRDNIAELDAFVDKWTPLLRLDDFVMTSGYHDWAGQFVYHGVGPLPDHNNKPRCSELYRGVVILVDGSVVACTQDVRGAMCLGNLNDGPLESIWNGTPLHRLQDAHRTGELAAFPLCHACPRPTQTTGSAYTNVSRVDRVGRRT